MVRSCFRRWRIRAWVPVGRPSVVEFRATLDGIGYLRGCWAAMNVEF